MGLRAAALLLGVVVAGSLVAACLDAPAGVVGSVAARGRETRELVVRDYLAGLERSDAAAIASLVSPRGDASRDIAAVLAAYGGQRLRDVTFTYVDEFGGMYVLATVVGVGATDSIQHEIRVQIAHVDGSYFLALGEAAPSGSESNPRSP